MKEEKDHSPKMLDQHPILYLPKEKREALEPRFCRESGSITQTTPTDTLWRGESYELKLHYPESEQIRLILSNT